MLLIRRCASTVSNHIRNVGIIAHIDAGKTTTTERMLFNAGRTQYLGEVDRGDTVTDYLAQERERGITIVSAAACLPWCGHSINLIDTPGHVDFTLEVERCLAVLDGAVALLDATKGVQAQTMTVWRQAVRYGVPRLIYLNKMDRRGADMSRCLHSVRSRFPDIVPLPVHWPVYAEDGTFQGIIDLVRMNKKIWHLSPDTAGVSTPAQVCHLDSDLEPDWAQHRGHLLEALVELDEELAENFLSIDAPVHRLSAQAVDAAIKRVTLTGRASPVLCGSSRRNIGIQCLLDAILHWLPNPTERLSRVCPAATDVDKHHDRGGGDMVALAFKTVHDKQRGPLTLLRLYTGALHLGDTVFNLTHDAKEKVTRLIQLTGDQYVDVKSVTGGGIVAATGLRHTFTGDVLVHLSKTGGHHHLQDGLVNWLEEIGASMDIPDPVVFAALEPASLSQMKPLEHALACLMKEDPSFKVRVDEETGQTVIGGLGDLHLEVMLARIQKEYGVEVSMGRLIIGYRETPYVPLEQPVQHCLSTVLDGRKLEIAVEASVSLLDNDNAKSQIHLTNSIDFRWSDLDRKLMAAVQEGGQQSLQSGPLLRCPVLGARVNLHRLELPPRVPANRILTLVKAATIEAVREALKQSTTALMEPLMRVEVTLSHGESESADHLSHVVGDLSRRRGIIEDVMESGSSQEPELWSKTLIARAPLEHLMGYSTALRSLTSGRASLHLHLDRYQRMQPEEEQRRIREMKYAL